VRLVFSVDIEMIVIVCKVVTDIIKVAETQQSRLRAHGPNGERNAQTAETL
jgi:hypothetical protein